MKFGAQSLGAQAETVNTLLQSVLLDASAFVISLSALIDPGMQLHSSLKQWYGVFWVVNEITGIVAVATSLVELGFDTAKLYARWTSGA